jgi:hypothetical protein
VVRDDVDGSIGEVEEEANATKALEAKDTDLKDRASSIGEGSHEKEARWNAVDFYVSLRLKGSRFYISSSVSCAVHFKGSHWLIPIRKYVFPNARQIQTKIQTTTSRRFRHHRRHHIEKGRRPTPKATIN